MGLLNTLDPDTIKAFQAYLSMPIDGQWTPELASKVGAYQQILGQTPGQTDTADQYGALVSKLQGRYNAYNTPLDATPAQDPAYQLFMRNSGAQEGEIMDEIAYRTEQNSREINRRAAGFAAQKEEATQNASTAQTQGARKITNDFADRGFGGQNTTRDQQLGTLTGNINQATQQQIGGINQQQLDQTANSRDALATAVRSLNSDAASLYRRRAEEELAGRNRVLQTGLNQNFGTGTYGNANATYF